MSTVEKNFKSVDDKILSACRVPYYHLNNLNLDFSEIVLDTRRVCRVTSGGVAFSISMFAAIIAVGKYRKTKGFFFGFGKGASKGSAEAKMKAINSSKRSIYFVPMRGSTIPFRITCKRFACLIEAIPVPRGSGVTAGGSLRKFLQTISSLVDFDINVKVIKGSSPVNILKCFFHGLIENVKLSEYYLLLKSKDKNVISS